MGDGIGRSEAVGALRRWEGDVDELEQDPRLAGMGIGRADLDRDGRIAGDDEVGALARRMDEADGRLDGRIDIADDDGDATGAAAVVEAISEAARAKRLRELALAREGVPRIERGIVYLGMNHTARAEATELRRHAPVISVPAGGGPDLGSRAAIRAFVARLKLTDAMAARVAAIIEAAEPPARPALAGLARVWAAAERGGEIPARLVLSGHGNGVDIWGDPRRALRLSSVLDLARAMPRAARQVRALNLASCNHGHRSRMHDLRSVFPRLDSIWGYAGYSPTNAEARRHLRIWDDQTRPLGPDGEGVDRSAVEHRPRGEHVQIWSRRDGYDGPPLRPLEIIRAELEATRSPLDWYLDGSAVVEDPMGGYLAERYDRLQEAIGHPDFRGLPRSDRAVIEREAAQVLRLRYFSPLVTSQFERQYESQIGRGYSALGLRAPSLRSMSRASAVAEVARFGEALRRHPSPPTAARELGDLLERGLRDLSADIIDPSWL